MPIYEYRCKDCHQIFEEWTKQIGDDTPRVCPVCNSPAERIMSNTSFVLNGDGWYVTDYGFKSKEKTGTAEKSQAQAQSTASAAAPASPATPATPAAASSGGTSAA